MKTPHTTRISSDTRILGGKPVIEGTRISVEFILELLRSGMTIENIVTHYDHLKNSDIEAAIAFAKRAVARQRVYSMNDYVSA